jgi:hypothetical protein
MSIFGKKQKCIFYIKRNALSVFTQEKHFIGEIPFDTTIVRNQEIHNKKQLTSRIIHFFESRGLKSGTSVVILERALVFEQALPAKGYKPEATEDFKANLPFYSDKLKIAVLQVENQVVQLAINGDYVDTVVETLRGLKHNIDVVIPEHILGSLLTGSFLSKEFNQKVFENLKQIKDYDLFSGSGSEKITSLGKK